MAKRRKSSDDDDGVGYGSPPKHSRFKKGKSGNPSGRPRGKDAERMKALVLKEAYRLVTVKDGDDIKSVPALQAVVRSTIAQAAKGNGPARRSLLELVGSAEAQEVKKGAATKDPELEARPMSNIEIARRIAFALELGRRELEAKKKAEQAAINSLHKG